LDVILKMIVEVNDRTHSCSNIFPARIYLEII
jgi:hypothetical protein